MMTNYEDQIKSKLIDELKYAIDFFEKHGLRYFMGWGSAIGTVRHHNIIPWDDDIDLFMPRPDYNRLIELRNEMSDSKYGLIVPGDEGYHLGWAKIEDKSTTLWELEHFPVIMGVFIDIFPLDLSNEGMVTVAKKWSRHKELLLLYQRSLKTFKFKSFSFLEIRDLLSCIAARRNKNYYLQEYLKHEKTLNREDGDYYICYVGIGLFAYRREWFDDYILMDFADFQVRVCAGYDEYLRYTYGNYMELPPIEQRKIKHFRHYINLQERLSLEEVKNRIKKGEKCK